MSPRQTAADEDSARGAASAPSPGLEAVWTHPMLARMAAEQRRWKDLDRRRPWLLDTILVLGVALVSLPDLLSAGGHGPFGDTGNRTSLPTWALWTFAAALVAPLWWRRRAPVPVWAVIAAVTLAEWSLGVWQIACVSGLIALYTLARQGPPRVLPWAAGINAVTLSLAAFVLVPLTHPQFGVFFLLGTAAAAVAIGLTLRIREMYNTALQDRATRLEIEREQRDRLTAAAERSRVAREMHDIVGHNLSVMVTLADGAAKLAANRGEQSEAPLRMLGDTGRQAMGELRRVLGVLREQQQPDETRLLEPQPGIGDLEPLLARVRAAGLTVTYRSVGDLESLSEGVQLTVYRIVQEALTNTLKHAGPGSSAEVAVVAEPGQIRIRVVDTGTPSDNGPRTGHAPQAEGSGHGLIGIRQRAVMYGGTVTIGPREAGHGWIVDVALDLSSPAKGHHP